MNVDLPMMSPAACCRPLDEELSADDAEATAKVFKALSDPTRVRIVSLLARAPAAVCVCELTPTIGLAQPTVSHHLKKLVQAGLLQRERRGVWAYYTLDRDGLARAASVFDLEGVTV